MQWHWLRKLIENKYCVYVLDRFWSRQLNNNNNLCLIALPLTFTFCFIYVWMKTSSLGFMYTWSWLDMCLIFQLFICLFDCWLWVTEMGWPKLCHLMLSSPCKACLCGSSVSKHNLELTFGSGSVSKMCLCEDYWQPNNCLYYPCFLLYFRYGVSFVFCCFAWTCGGSDVNDSYGRRFLSLYSWWSILCLVGMHK